MVSLRASLRPHVETTVDAGAAGEETAEGGKSLRSLLIPQDMPCSPSTVFQRTLGACSQNVHSNVDLEKQSWVSLVKPTQVRAGGPGPADLASEEQCFRFRKKSCSHLFKIRNHIWKIL